MIIEAIYTVGLLILFVGFLLLGALLANIFDWE